MSGALYDTLQDMNVVGCCCWRAVYTRTTGRGGCCLLFNGSPVTCLDVFTGMFNVLECWSTRVSGFGSCVGDWIEPHHGRVGGQCCIVLCKTRRFVCSVAVVCVSFKSDQLF